MLLKEYFGRNFHSIIFLHALSKYSTDHWNVTPWTGEILHSTNINDKNYVDLDGKMENSTVWIFIIVVISLANIS